MPVQSEAVKTNVILTDIKKILGAGQTPADQKDAADAQKEAAKAMVQASKKDPGERLRDASGKFIKATEEDSKDKKTTHEKTLGLFGMIKNDVTEWALKSDENQITWGNMGKVIKESVKNWFKKVSQTNSLLGRTFRVGAALWNNVFKKIGERFKQAFDTIVGQVKEVLGPGVMAVFEFAKSTLMAAYETTKKVFGSFFEGFKKVPPADKKRNKFLRGMLHEMIRARKGKFTEGLGKKKGPGFFKSLGIGTLLLIKAIAIIIGIFYAIYKFWQGFKMSDAETWAGKFKDGIKNMILSVVKWPLMLLEWLLGKLGFASEGLTKSVTEWLGKWIDFVYGFTPLAAIINFVEGFFKTDGTFIEKLKGGFEMMVGEFKKHLAKWGPILADAISPIIKGVVDFFATIWNALLSYMISEIPDWLPLGGSIAKNLSGKMVNMARAGDAGKISDAQARAFQGRAGNAGLRGMPLNEVKDLMAEANARHAAGMTESVHALLAEARDTGSYKTEVKQEVDEVENMGIIQGNVDQEYS